MIRFAACAVVAFLAFVARADDPPTKRDDKAVAAKIEAPQLTVPKGDTPAAKDYADIIKATNEELKKAANLDAMKTIVAATAGEIVAHARKYPTDESTLTALVQAIGLSLQSPDGAKTRATAAELIKTNFARSPAIRRQLRSLPGGFDDACADVVREVYKSHSENLTRAQAAKVLITSLEQREKLADQMMANEAARASVEKLVGKEGVQKIIDTAPAAKKEVETYRAALQNELKGLLPDVSVGAVAPETAGVNLDGKSVKLADLKGKVVVLDFWATWCGPCKATIPHTREMVKSMDGKPFAFVSISVDDEKETLTKFLEKEPMPWSHWWDGQKAVSDQWDVDAYPTLYVIDHNGVIRFKTVGYDPKTSKMDATIQELVKAAEAGK
jgi:thiol-disulfide isomerase/thioredoxin